MHFSNTSRFGSSLVALVAPLVVLAACSSSDDDSAPAPAANVASTSAVKVALTVDVEGTAHVRSEPAGIDCPGQCEAEFPAGTQVKLVSAPAEGWKLQAWSGACTGDGACEVAMQGAASVRGAHALIDPRWDPSFGAGDCADAWGSAGEKLSPCDKTPDDYVVIRKAKRNLALCNSGKLVKNLRVGLGFTPTGDKQQQGDGRTPEGVFYIPTLLPDSDYHRAFLFSYPQKDDAARAANEGLVSREEADQIIKAQTDCTEPSQSTNLGGAVEIHGEGLGQSNTRDWTAGCVALANAELDLLWAALEKNDTIVVLP